MANNTNTQSFPCLIQLEGLQTIQGVDDLGLHLQANNSEDILNASQIVIEASGNPVEVIPDFSESMFQNIQISNQEQSCVFQVVYPQDLNLISPANQVKRGRPKKRKIEESQANEPPPPPEITKVPVISARTRSGRLVKLPKQLERDFKKIEITSEDQDIQISDFKRCEEKENTKCEFVSLQAKKRVIKHQFKCPKCLKVYLGKNKMIEHLKKFPDHGPLPDEFHEHNFNVWNYLFDITQKCKPGQRGLKFCEELSNLLHNVQLLKSALFKTETDGKNSVQVDKVLGNAIGLAPGKYKFDETELYKDVTVLKLITNSDFFNPNFSKSDAVNKGKEQTESKSEASDSKRQKSCTEKFNAPGNETVGDTNGMFHKEHFYEYPSGKTDKSEDAKQSEDQRILPPPDLLSESLLSLPHPTRNSVDELILSAVDTSTNIMDNSTSSDEVMNVDQFVNERFKKIIEPDMELVNTSLNLDLPSLDLFQFHTS